MLRSSVKTSQNQGLEVKVYCRWRTITQRLMEARMVVKSEPAVQTIHSFAYCFIILKVHLLVFHRAPQTLDHYIIHGTATTIHTDANALRHPGFGEIVRRTGATPAQTIFRFALGVGMLPITGTTSPSHMREESELRCVRTRSG